jgi:integrase/recombinase XerD
VEKATLAARWPAIASCSDALSWLQIQVDLGLSPRTVEAYARALTDYLTVCRRDGIQPLTADRSEIAHYVRDLRQRPHRRGARIVALDSGAGLADATLQQRLVAVRLFYDHLIEDGKRETNPVGRGRFTPGHFGGHGERGLVSRFVRLPWIPTEEQWRSLLSVAATEPLRTRVMLAMAYDAALRREELCSLRTDDLDPAHRMIRVSAETTKGRRQRTVPYSAATGALLQAYLHERRQLSAARGRCSSPFRIATGRSRSRCGPGPRLCGRSRRVPICHGSARTPCGICA